MMLKYIELKSGFADNGPAWVARVTLSKSGRTVYFNGKALQRASGSGMCAGGNHVDIESGDEYWVSGLKKRGLDRHWAGGGVVSIEASAVAEYLAFIGVEGLDRTRFQVIADLKPPDPAKFTAIENEKRGENQDVPGWLEARFGIARKHVNP